MLRFCGVPRPLGVAVGSLEWTAASIAIALYLEGVSPVPDELESAAIAAALEFAAPRSRPSRHADRASGSGWALSGRMSHMGLRVAHQERSRSRAAL